MTAADQAEKAAQAAGASETAADVTATPGSDVTADKNGTQILLQLGENDEDLLYQYQFENDGRKGHQRQPSQSDDLFHSHDSGRLTDVSADEGELFASVS